jgi:hypothetical protein
LVAQLVTEVMPPTDTALSPQAMLAALHEHLAARWRLSYRLEPPHWSSNSQKIRLPHQVLVSPIERVGLSVPELVEQAAGQLDLDRSAASAYLQVLTLAEPTSKNLAVWNDWRPKQVSSVLDGLVERGLLTRGTCSRAGRDVFLPGAWEELKAPNLPIEAWKQMLYEGAPLDGRILPMRPLHELFAAAWQRVQLGDAPAFAPAPADGRCA